MRLVAPVGAVAVIALLLLGAGTAAACGTPPSQPSPTVLTTIPLIDAIAANSSMVFAQGVANCSQIWAITPSGSVFLYATVPVANSACDEGALVLAPALNCTTHIEPPQPDLVASSTSRDSGNGGAYGHGDCHHNATGIALYDVVAGGLYEITDNGANVTQLATFPISGKPAENMGLAYDQVGTFNHDLIVTSSYRGEVWLYNCTNTTVLVKLHTYIGGPAVAPMRFGAYGGDLVLAAKTRGEVLAISPTGTVSIVANWSKANAVTFPSAGGYGQHGWNGDWGWGGCGGGCTFGPEHYALFVANYSSGALEAFPASDLRGYAGQGFVAGGLNQGIATFTSNGATTLFASQTQRLSDIASVTCFPSQSSWGHGWGGGGGRDPGGP
jgi:hypothetical protein